MTEQAIQDRLKELDAMRAEQEARLTEARQQQAYAAQSLERILGARMDCEHWLDAVQKAAPAAAPVPQDILPFPGVADGPPAAG